MQGVHQREPLASGEATSQVGRISAQILSPVSLVSIDLFCVSVCRCVCVWCVFVCVQAHVHVCGGQRITLGVAFWELSPWILRQGLSLGPGAH